MNMQQDDQIMSETLKEMKEMAVELIKKANDPSKSMGSLPTLPFEIFCCLLKSTSISTEDGLNMRVAALDQGAIHMILACLAIFTHHPEAIPLMDPGNQHASLLMALKQCCSNVNNKKLEAKSHQYWAKGTGFGTGSTTQSWNVEQALCRQKVEEEHVTLILQILASFINPDEILQDQPLYYICTDLFDSDNKVEISDETLLPPLFIDLIEHSCLLSAISSYLRNDSVLDMARHIPLYRAILVLLRVMALNSQLVKFLLPTDSANLLSSSKNPLHNGNDQSLSLVALLQKMRTCVETYSSRLKKNQGTGTSATESISQEFMYSFSVEDDDDGSEGLIKLIPDIRATAKIVEIFTEKVLANSNSVAGRSLPETNGTLTSLEETYLRIMKNLQFDTYDMISEAGDGLGFKFNVSYHFERMLRADVDINYPPRMKRLAQEAVTLSTSLPLSYSSSVFVRCDTDRLDVMKVLITGPAETPYANGCFEFDVYFPPNYPNSPVLINLETTGRHSVRFNPNLYNDGKVCLSVLNTWQGRPEEKWNAQVSSILQVLVSIQSLILVPEPYFNEPGYERSRGTAVGNKSSRKYNANIMQATVKWAMLNQLRNPSPCFKDIIQTHFYLKRNEIKNQITNWINEIESDVSDYSKAKSNSLRSTPLKTQLKTLCDEFVKLHPPAGLEELNSLSQFDHDAAPSTSTSLPLVMDLSATASTSAPSTSSLPLSSYTQMEKIIAELLD